MEIIKLTDQNIEDEHICCGFSDKKCADGYQKKKDWLKKEFKNGYTFRKLDARGKVFIEYVPIEHSWLPINGKNFMVVNCFWVSGKFKGKGYGKKLLLQCIADAKSKKMDGIIAVSSDKKRPFMSDPKFFLKQGFEIIDEAPPHFKLFGLKINQQSNWPQFKPTAKKGSCKNNGGITVYYSNSCPFNDFYTNVFMRQYADSKGVPLSIHHIKTKKDGHKMPIPWVLYSVFYKGEFVSVQVKPDRELDKLIP